MPWLRMLLFGAIGLLTQVVFGAVRSAVLKGNRTLTSSTSLWFIPAFSLIAILYPPVYHRISGFGVLFRGITYMFVFFIVQYVVGWLMDKAGVRPWSHSGKLAISGGLVDFKYAPLWFLAGFGVEKLWPYITRVVSSI